MPHVAKCPIVPFASVGDTVQADNGQMYVIMWVDGARVRLKHLGPNGRAGKGRPSNGLMSGDAAKTIVDNIGVAPMEGAVKREPMINIPIYKVTDLRK